MRGSIRSELTASDVLAMNNARDNGFLEGNGIIILILFFLMFGGNFGNWGGNASMQGALTRAELTEGLNNQTIQSDIRSIENSINQNNIGMLNGFANINQTLNCGFDNVNSGIANLGFNMQNCCCQIKEAVHSEGEQTRALIQQNTIQQLRDELADKDRELLSRGIITAQTLQTSDIQNFIRTMANGCSCC